MPSSSIPVDVFRFILEHVDRASLAKICLLNKICCSYSQDVLYRNIHGATAKLICHTLAQSTHLAKRVRSFEIYYEHPSLEEALRNMSSLRRLCLYFNDPESPTLLEGCTFKLDSLSVSLPFCEPLRKFLNSQPSLTFVSFAYPLESESPFEETLLPNLTRVAAESSWLSQLIPGRPVSEVTWLDLDSDNLSDYTFFTLSTVPIRKLEINYWSIMDTTLVPFALIFPSLTHLKSTVFFSPSQPYKVRESFH
jgi:hypothetical protein